MIREGKIKTKNKYSEREREREESIYLANFSAFW